MSAGANVFERAQQRFEAAWRDGSDDVGEALADYQDALLRVSMESVSEDDFAELARDVMRGAS